MMAMIEDKVPKIPAGVAETTLSTHLVAGGLQRLPQGKARDSYLLPNQSNMRMVVVTDRLSAFDIVTSSLFPCKGYVLNAMNHFAVTTIMADHDHDLIAVGPEIDRYLPPHFRGNTELQARASIVMNLKMLKVEGIARGYLTGSAVEPYQKTGEVCGIKLPPGLIDGSKLPEPAFTPSTKYEDDNDEHMDAEDAERQFGIKQLTLELYNRCAAHGLPRGIIFVDTKAEFGLDRNRKMRYADERGTPDSSRFWPAATYDEYLAAEKPQPSFDKQFVRDFLKTVVTEYGPFPKLKPKIDEQRAAGHAVRIPPEIIGRTTELYLEIFELWTGNDPEAYIRYDMGVMDFRLPL